MKAARFATIAGALLFVAMASTASAAVRPVDISGFAFVPQSVTIAVGDTITWTNRDAAAHSARVNGVGTTAVLTQGQSGSLPFMNAGTFPYDCGVHGASMMGTVIVRAAATPPPTPVPTARPTVAPTVVTPLPTVAQTAAPTPTASPSPIPTAAPTTAAPSLTPLPSLAVAAPTEQAPAPAAGDGAGTIALLVGGAVLALLGVGAFALTRIKR